MKNASLRLLTAVGFAVTLSVVGIAPANAAPVASNVATAQKAVVKIPTVSITKIANFSLPSTSARRTVAPIYTKPAGTTPIFARMRVTTTAGKLITASATRVNLGVGSYKITSTVRYSYMQGKQKLYRTVSSAQTLAVALVKPKPAPAGTVAISAIANSKATSATAVRTIRPAYKAYNGAKVISARVGVTQGSKVITPSATSIGLKPGSYALDINVRYSYMQNGKQVIKTANRKQPLTISYTAPRPPVVTQPANTFEQGVINAFNVYRTKAGLAPLKTNASLNAYNTRWVNSNFTLNESMDNISPYIMFVGKAQSSFSPGMSPTTLAAGIMNKAGGKELIYRPYVDHISVVQKNVNGGVRVGVTFAGIYTP